MEHGLWPNESLVEIRQVGPAFRASQAESQTALSSVGFHHEPNSPAQRRWAKRAALEQGIASSRGGRTTKVHIIADEAGRPLHCRVTDGAQHDIRAGTELIAVADSVPLSADKAYDADAFRAALTARGAEPVIPPKRNRSSPIAYDRTLYKQRNVVERCFSWMKHQRRFATRYDKLQRNYSAFVALSCGLLWLRHPPS